MPASTTPDRLAALVARTPPFDTLAPEHRRALLDDALVQFAEPGAVLLPAGTDAPAHLFLVVDGRVRLVDAEDGHLVDECGEGDVFGAYGLLRGGAVPYEARATEATTYALIPAARFQALYDAEPDFAAFFDHDLTRYARTQRPAVDAGGVRVLFHTCLRDLVRRAPVTCPPETSAREAARQMRAAHVGSILVADDAGRALGILTNTDLRDHVVADGRSPDTPVGALMSAPIIHAAGDAPVFDGLLTMMQRRMHHLVITKTADPASPVLGIISDQDVARAHGHNPASLIKRIEQTDALAPLTGLRDELNGHLLQLYRQGVQAEDLVAINTEVNDRLTVRVLRLTEERLRAEHPGEAVDVPWAWMALGSEGRREMSLKTDQDNALLYADPSSEAEAQACARWFERFAHEANDALARCGFTLCPGDVMARNPKWRQPLAAWKRTFRRWITEPSELALMHTSIFFDLRALHGDAALVGALKDDLKTALDDERGFLAFLMHNALALRPPLSFFGRFVLERTGEHRHTFDVKLRGLMPVVDIARLLALDARYLDVTNTLARLHHVQHNLPRLAATAASAADAYRFLTELRLGHHLDALGRGADLDNRIDPGTLSKVQQNMLKAAFATVSDMQDVLAHRYGAEMMRR